MLLSSGTISGTNFIGGLIGNFASGSSTINGGATSTGGAVQGSTAVGGLFGGVTAGTFTPIGTLSNVATVNGNTAAGGIFGGFSLNTNVSNNMSNTALITGTGAGSSIAGIVGSMLGGTFSGNLTNSGNVSVAGASTFIGGLFGGFSSATVSGALANSGDVTAANSDQVGGVFGQIGASVTLTGATSQNTGNVTGGDDVGGVIGTIGIDNNMSTMFSSGAVTGENNVGGIIGDVNSNLITPTTLSNLLFTGSVVGTGSNVGGIAGFSDGTIQFALGIGTVSGPNTTTTGALIGNNAAIFSLDNSVYDTGINSGLAAVGTNSSGAVNNLQSGTGTAFSNSTLYTTAGFTTPPWSFGASGNTNYASLTFCGAGCISSIGTLPTPTPSPGVVSAAATAIDTTTRNAELEGTTQKQTGEVNEDDSGTVALKPVAETNEGDISCVDGGTGCMDEEMHETLTAYYGCLID